MVRKHIYYNLQIDCGIHVAVLLALTDGLVQGMYQHKYIKPQNRRSLQGKKLLKTSPMLVFYALAGVHLWAKTQPNLGSHASNPRQALTVLPTVT